MAKIPTLYSIPAGFSFVDVLAQGLLEKAGANPLALSSYLLLLPTRRACRSLRDAFLRQSDGRALLLPRMQPIGEVDSDELALSIAPTLGMEGVSIPPAIPATKRLFLLNLD